MGIVCIHSCCGNTKLYSNRAIELFAFVEILPATSSTLLCDLATRWYFLGGKIAKYLKQDYPN